MTIQEMGKRKKELGLTYAMIASRSGLPLPTVQKVLSGRTRSPRYDTVLALERVLGAGDSPSDPENGQAAPYESVSVFSGDHSDEHCNTRNTPGAEERYDRTEKYQPRTNMILAAETAPAYGSASRFDAPSGKKRGQTVPGLNIRKGKRNSYPLLPYKEQGEYTREDREQLPQDVRTELIDGVIYDMASPKAVHQIILMELSYQLRSQIDRCGKECMVFIAPSDVWLTYDDKNIFQPDIYVLCDYSMIDRDGYTKGAPPFVIEILSSSSRSRDLLLKTYKYHAAGVHEYWIIDPEKKRILVYDFDRDPDGTEYTSYSFDNTIPIGFSKGSCSVDFTRIAETLSRAGL